ncbi:DUF5324 family protein [Streptomyces sp. NPDC004647]|uniref:DUF5324 family protein n=1 Tax=Streptomyces sp. NPDC004647 TaxID=3154671 RepID=UPI0033A319DD
MTRIDSVRAATGTAKDSVVHAAEVVAPYAGTARDQAAHYAQEARARLAPKVSHAAQQARDSALVQYDTHLQPRLQHGFDQARGALPPKVDAAASRAAKRARKAAKQAAEYTVPRVEHAVAAAEPMREEAVQRSAAALAALRGDVTAADIEKLVRKRRRRAKGARAAKRVLVLGALAGGAIAVWKWWEKQANPDWLVEPPAATELGDRPLTSVDGSEQAALDPEVQAKQAEAEAQGRKRGHKR